MAQAAIEEYRAGLDRLVQERGRAFYGDEAGDIPASDLFTETMCGHASPARAMTAAWSASSSAPSGGFLDSTRRGGLFSRLADTLGRDGG